MIVEKYDATKFLSMKRIWKSLENGEDMSVYQTYEWNNLLNKQYLNYSKLYRLICKYEYYVFYDNNEPRVILPLMIKKVNLTLKGHGIRKGVYIIGSNNYSDYLNWIYCELKNEYFDFIINWLNNNFIDYDISFLCIKEETKLNKQLITKKGIKKIEDTISVYVKNENDPEEYNKKLSKNTRKNLRKAINRIHKKNVIYEIKELSMVEDNVLIKSLINLHIKRYIQKNSDNNKMINYIKWIKEIILEKRNNIVSESMKNLNNSWLLVIYLNNEIGGYLYGLKWRDEINIMQVCVNTKYGFFTPVIRGVYDYIIQINTKSDRDIDKLDFTRGNERYKYELNGKNRILHNFLMKKELD